MKSHLFKLILLLLLLLLAGCGGGSNGINNSSNATNEVEQQYTYIPKGDKLTNRMALRFLNMTTFGSTPELVQELRNKGVVKWLDEQLSIPYDFKKDSVSYLAMKAQLDLRPESIGLRLTYGGKEERDFNKSADEYIERYFTPNDFIYNYTNHESVLNFLSSAVFARQIEGRAQLRQRVAFALSQIVIASESNDHLFTFRGDALMTYYDVLLKDAFGNYGDLLYDVSMTPAMATFLTYANNKKLHIENNVTVTPDENYGREIMQLFSIGLFELNMDGSIKFANGKQIPTYIQKDVNEMSRIFTGLYYAHTNFGDSLKKADTLQPMQCDMNWHDTGTKQILGKTLAGGNSCSEDIHSAINLLMSHSNTPPFIAKKLIMRLTKSNPSGDYIQRVATVFKESNGDLAKTIKAILLDPELWEDLKNNRITKFKEPYIALLNILRPLHIKPFKTLYFPANTNYHIPARNTPNTYWVPSQYKHIGEWPLYEPSVFNFYSDDFIPNDPSFKSNKYVAPEISVMNTKYIISFANLVSSILEHNGYNRLLSREDFNETRVYKNHSFLTFVHPLFTINYKDQLQLYRNALGEKFDKYASNNNKRQEAFRETLDKLINDLEQRFIGEHINSNYRQKIYSYYENKWFTYRSESSDDERKKELRNAATITEIIIKVLAKIIRSEEFITN